MLEKHQNMIRDIIASKRKFGLPETGAIGNWNPIFDNDCSAKDLLELEASGYVDSKFFGPSTFGHTEYSLTGRAVNEFGK